MDHISIKPGDLFTIGEDIAIQFDKIADACSHLDIDAAYDEVTGVCGPIVEPTKEDIQTHLWRLSKEIVNGLSKLGLDERNEFLGAHVKELYYTAATQDRREKNHRRQAEGIAAAKAKGVQFGPQRRVLPDSFEELRQAWREKRMTLRAAAEACGIPKTTFRSAALRAEMAASGVEDML